MTCCTARKPHTLSNDNTDFSLMPGVLHYVRWSTASPVIGMRELPKALPAPYPLRRSWRCRLGLHRWQRVWRAWGPTLTSEGLVAPESGGVFRRCARCGKQRGL